MAHSAWRLLILLILTLAACAGPPPTPSPSIAMPTTAPTTSAATRATTAPTSAAAPTQPPPALPTAPVATGKPLIIGQVTDLTGGLHRYGEMQVRGLALGIEYATQGTNIVAGRAIRVITRDSEGKADVGAAQASQLVEMDGAEILQCCPSSVVAMAVQDVAKDKQRVLMVEPAASPDLTGKTFNRYTFRTSRTTEQDILTVAAYVAKNAGTTFIQIAPDDSYGHGTAATWRRAIEQAGGRFLADDLYISSGTTDFGPFLQRVVESKAQALIVTWAGNGFMELFDGIQQRELTRQMAVVTGFGDNTSIRGAYGGVTDLIGPTVYHYALPKNTVNDWLVAQHLRRFGAPPDIYTAGSMAAGIALVEALKKTAGATDGDKLIAALEGLTFDSPKGKMTFRAEDHVALQPMYVVRLKSTTDPQLRFFELLEERKPEDTAPPVSVPK